MTIINFPSNLKFKPFIKDIKKYGYHVFSFSNAKNSDYYPSKYPAYREVGIKTLKIGDITTIRVFFRSGSGRNMQVYGGCMDLRIEFIDGETIFAVILTEIPKGFSLETGGSLKIYEDEILYKTETTEH